MRVSLIGLAQNAANELERVWRKNERHRASHVDCDCPLCCNIDHTGFYAACLRELAANAKELKNDPSKADEFMLLYALKDPKVASPTTGDVPGSAAGKDEGGTGL